MNNQCQAVRPASTNSVFQSVVQAYEDLFKLAERAAKAWVDSGWHGHQPYGIRISGGLVMFSIGHHDGVMLTNQTAAFPLDIILDNNQIIIHARKTRQKYDEARAKISKEIAELKSNSKETKLKELECRLRTSTPSSPEGLPFEITTPQSWYCGPRV